MTMKTTTNNGKTLSLILKAEKRSLKPLKSKAILKNLFPYSVEIDFSANGMCQYSNYMIRFPEEPKY